MLDGSIVWDDFKGMPVTSLTAKFRMPDIERYTSIGCSRIHLRLYSTLMRAHGLDESQMITLFPLSLSGAALVCILGVLTTLDRGRLGPGVLTTVFI